MTPPYSDLKEAAEKATPQNFDTALAKFEDGWAECPVCSGEGSIEVHADYENYDDVAIGVQFYGVGEHHRNAEEYYRLANPARILSLIEENERLREALESIAEPPIGYAYLNPNDLVIILAENARAALKEKPHD